MRTLSISRVFRWTAVVAAVVLSGMLFRPVRAEQCCGAQEQCGQRARHSCGKCGACQLVCDVKEEKKTVWVVKCESMCTILPGCGPAEKVCAGDGCGKCGETCSTGCADGKANGCACLVPPKCGRQRNIQKLEKKEITVKVPVYKCVACGCQTEKCAVEQQPAPSKAPSTPAAPAPAPTAPKAPKPPKPTAPKAQALEVLPKVTMEEAPWPSLAHAN